MNDKTVVLNTGLVNYGGNVDYSKITSEVVVYDEASEDRILERVSGSTIIVTKEMKATGDIIRKFPDSMKMIHEAGTGYNNIDLGTVREKGIILYNIPAYSDERVAHTMVLMILNLADSVQKQIRMPSEGNHDNFHKYLVADHVGVNGETLGIIGYGNIAKGIIKVAQTSGVKVLVTTRTPRANVENVHFTTNEEAFMQSDSISLNCSSNESTRYTVNKGTLAMMKPTAYLVNTAWGALVDEKALIDASQDSVIVGAGLGVQEVELLDDASPLYVMGNVVITPHVGWWGLETRQHLVSLVRDNIETFSKGQPINRVD